MRPDADYYPGLDTVLIYPEAFVVDHDVEDEHGFVHGGEDELAGESWQRGVVVLSWQDVSHEAGARNGYNVVLHEFAHQLDELTGEADGCPPLADPLLAARWPETFGAAFARHRRLCRRRREVLFDAGRRREPRRILRHRRGTVLRVPRRPGRRVPGRPRRAGRLAAPGSGGLDLRLNRRSGGGGRGRNLSYLVGSRARNHLPAESDRP